MFRNLWKFLNDDEKEENWKERSEDNRQIGNPRDMTVTFDEKKSNESHS
jgi:hypothetical protein